MNLSSINQNTGNIGGGLFIDGHLIADSSTISGNSASGHGGGIYGDGTIDYMFSDINDNASLEDGGGIWWGSGQVTIERSNIQRNNAHRGGGTFILAENPIFQFDVISLNNAETIGGGMYISKASDVSSTPIIFNSTVVYNTSAVLGSGLLCTNHTNPVVQNSIFWGNLAADGVQMHLQGASEIFVTYCDVAGGQSGIVGFDDIIYQNNIDQYPDFVDADNEDYQLLITSPCIDTGNPNAPNDPDGTVPDMGAYYFAQDGIPNIETDNMMVNFSGVAVNEEQSLLLSVTNTGLADLIVSGASFTSDAFSTEDTNFTIASMETYQVEILFSPTSEGVHDGLISFETNDPDEQVYSVQLHGAGDGLAINSVLDVPNDQGGYVGVAWHRNVFDGIDDSETIVEYNVWRRYDGSIRSLSDTAITMTWPQSSRDEVDGSTWELIGTSPATEFENYAFSAPTIYDSTDFDIPWSVFLVSAHTQDPNSFYVSEPDSGYSIDNIAPGFSQGVYYTYSPGVVTVYYEVPGNEDVDFYEILKEGEPFLTTSETYYAASLSYGSSALYQIRGTDVHGNVGEYSEPIEAVSGKVGDVTWDNTVDLLDVIRVVYMALHPSETFTIDELWSADVNQDEVIDVSDVIPIVDIIMGGSLSQLQYEPGPVHAYRVGQIVYLNAMQPVAGLQFTLNQSAEVVNLSGFESSWNQELGMLFTTNEQVILGDEVAVLELPEGVEIEQMTIVNHLGEAVEAVLEVDQDSMLPEVFAVHQNYPNPFNPSTTIQVDLTMESNLSVYVYDIIGREVRALLNENRVPGIYSIRWDGKDNAGHDVSTVHISS